MKADQWTVKASIPGQVLTSVVRKFDELRSRERP
jgi:hypothetical protein